MSVNKNFVVKNGIEVANNLLFASSSVGKVGIGSTVPSATLEVFGGTKSGDGFFSGILTSVGSFDVGPDGSAFYVDPSTSKVGINTTASGYTLNVNAPSGALISGGDLTVNNTVSVGGTIDAVRIEVGSATTITSGKVDVTGTVDATTGDFVNLNSTGVGTIATLDVDTGSIDYLTSGVGTIGNVKISSGIITASTGIVTYYGDGRHLTDVIAGVGIRTSGSIVGYGITLLDFRGSGVSTITTPSAGITTINIVGSGAEVNPSYSSINVSGIATIGTVEISSGIITSTSGIVTYYGDGRYLTGTAYDLVAAPGISSDSNYVGTGFSLFDFISGNNISLGVTRTGYGPIAEITVNTSENVDITDLNVSGVTTLSTLGATNISATRISSTDIYATGVTTVGIITGATSIGVTTVYANILRGDGTFLTGVVNEINPGTNITVASVGGLRTVGLNSIPNLLGLNLTSGIATVPTLSATTGTITNLNSTTGTITNGNVTNLSGTIGTIGTIDVTNATVTNISGSIGTYTVFNATDLTPTNINSSGITTIGTLIVQNNFDVYDSQATFHNDLYVVGNVTIGGTATSINAQELKVSDKDIVLGVTTDSNGNDISDDDTANHGGIAIASTVGSPLVDLRISGIETLPPTYKKIMWFKAGSFTGLGTDAWLTNYAVGIGSTQFPSGTRFASGSIRFTDDSISASHLNLSGIATAQDFNSLSDINYKENINTVNDALLKVDQLRGVSFDWKRTGSPSYGVIAQELEQVLPELVNGNDPKTVNYNGIIGILIEAIKELKQEIEYLKGINN